VYTAYYIAISICVPYINILYIYGILYILICVRLNSYIMMPIPVVETHNIIQRGGEVTKMLCAYVRTDGKSHKAFTSFFC